MLPSYHIAIAKSLMFGNAEILPTVAPHDHVPSPVAQPGAVRGRARYARGCLAEGSQYFNWLLLSRRARSHATHHLSYFSILLF